MSGTAYAVSAELAAGLGHFASYHDSRYGNVRDTPEPSNAPSMLGVIQRHRDHAHGLAGAGDSAEIAKVARSAWDQALELGRSVGFRNAQVTVLAPTGTIGFLMDCDTTGIEPEIALVKYKLLAGCGMLKIVNQTVSSALRRLGYTVEKIASILGHIERWDTIEDVTDPETGSVIHSGLMENKFAYQRFEPSGFTKNPDIRTAFSITDYVFRWLGCEFIQGYRKAISPDYGQSDLPMKEIPEMEKSAINRPVRELSAESAATRVERALGSTYMGITCSHCGSDKVIRAGACGGCTQCGTSQGCS